MADHLSAEQTAELKETFALFDRDGDDKITVGELGDVLRAVGHNCSQETVLAMLEEVDLDANGFIDFPEFLSIVAERLTNAEENENDLIETFKHYDLHGTGFITASNLRLAMGRLGCKLTPEEAEEMIREADLDGDGRLSYKDFRRVMVLPQAF